MQETAKIWMNGELVDWADATVHVGVHGLHYGTGVFEGIRATRPRTGRPCSGSPTTCSGSTTARGSCTWSCRTRSRSCGRRRTTSSRANGLPAATSGRSPSSATARSASHTRGNPVETVIMSWPWGAYLGEDALAKGITAKVSSWKRVGPNVIPHVSKATGIYLNSMLATTEAQRAGYDEGILLTDNGFVADGPGENIFVVKDGRILTPPLSTSILPGITRGQRHRDRPGPRLRRRGDRRDPHRPLPRRRGLHDGHRRRGDAGARDRRRRARRRRRHARAPADVPRRRSTAAPSSGATGSTSSRRSPLRRRGPRFGWFDLQSDTNRIVGLILRVDSASRPRGPGRRPSATSRSAGTARARRGAHRPRHRTCGATRRSAAGASASRAAAPRCPRPRAPDGRSRGRLRTRRGRATMHVSHAVRRPVRRLGHERDTRDAVEQLAIPVADPAARRHAHRKRLELRAPERGEEVAHPVVEADLGVLVVRHRLARLRRELARVLDPVAVPRRRASRRRSS